MPYFDRARVEYLRHLGLLHTRPAGLEFVMRREPSSTRRPARFDDLLEVFIRTSSIGRTLVALGDAPCTSASPASCWPTPSRSMVLIDRAARHAGARAGAHPRRGRRVRGQRVSIDGRVQAVIDGGEEADEILRASLAAVHEGAGAPWSAIASSRRARW